VPPRLPLGVSGDVHGPGTVKGLGKRRSEPVRDH
jgi:hypothetical protein